MSDDLRPDEPGSAASGPAAAMHEGQIEVSTDVVRALVAEQFPRWAGLPVRRVASSGTVNAVFRLGDRLAARFPLTGTDADQVHAWLEREAAAAAELVGRLPVPTPEPLGLGRPGHGYPLPWSVQTWVPGAVASEQDPGESVPFAHDLADLVRALRDIPTRGRRFAGPARGGTIATHGAWVEHCLDRSGALLDVPRLTSLWQRLRTLPRGESPDVMTHGDLVPGNVLVDRGRLAGVIDVGGFGPADPALELVAAWHLLDDRPRRVLRRDLGCDEPQWARGRAWAFVQAIGLVEYYAESNPALSAVGSRTLERVSAAPS